MNQCKNIGYLSVIPPNMKPRAIRAIRTIKTIRAIRAIRVIRVITYVNICKQTHKINKQINKKIIEYILFNQYFLSLFFKFIF